MRHTIDDIATGEGELDKVRIAGRPRPGKEEKYVLLEEPGPPIKMHYHGRQLPHFKRDCPHCQPDGLDELKTMVYVGAYATAGRELVIVELSWKCFLTAEAAARQHQGDAQGVDLFGQPLYALGKFRGLLVTIRRPNFAASPRWLGCEQRVKVAIDWPYETRRELARIWGIALKPRIFRSENA